MKEYIHRVSNCPVGEPEGVCRKISHPGTATTTGTVGFPRPRENLRRTQPEEGLGDGERDAFLRRFFPDLRKGLSVLDIGAGRRRLGTVNIDMDARVCPDVLCDMHSLPFKRDSFDAIVLCQVIEHAEHITALLRECHLVLRHGGGLHANFPNYGSFTVLYDWFRNDVLYSRDLVLGGVDQYSRHYQLLTPRIMKRLFEQQGFKLAYVSGIPPAGGPPGLRLLGKCLVKLFPNRAGTVTVVGIKE